MMASELSNDSREHRAVSALLPWYVNQTLADRDRELVESHLALCQRCREDLEREQHLFRDMRTETSLEYIPTASLKRLQAMIDGIDAAPAEPQTDAQRPMRRLLPWAGLMAASVAVLAVTISVLATDHARQFHARSESTAPYYTVTAPTVHAPGESVRAVFSPTITLVELQAILDEAQLRIVSGPTEAGVYSLAPTSQRPTRAALALLRAHSNVKFAEGTQMDTGAGEKP